MKNLILFSFLFFTSFNLFSQDEVDSVPFSSGTIYLNGSSGFNLFLSDDLPKLLQVGMGYFVADNFMLGANFQYVDFGQGSDSSLELEARYYVISNLFGGLSYQLDDRKIFSFALGYNIFLSKTVSLEPVFEYPFSDFSDPTLGIRISAFF